MPHLLTAGRVVKAIDAVSPVLWIVAFTLSFMDKLTVEQFKLWLYIAFGLVICKWVAQWRVAKARRAGI